MMSAQSTEKFGFDGADLAAADEAESVPAADAITPAGAANGLVYRSVEEFVTELLLPTYHRKIDGRSLTWCPQWVRHPEAVVRLEALWRSWEHLRLDPALGMSVWLRDHLDHHLPVLISPTGPFRGCSPQRGHQASPAIDLYGSTDSAQPR